VQSRLAWHLQTVLLNLPKRRMIARVDAGSRKQNRMNL
jgi:hypothetical protein